MQIKFDYYSNSSIDSDYDLPESLQEKIDYQKSDIPFFDSQYREFRLDSEEEQKNQDMPQPPKTSYHVLQKRDNQNLILDLEQIKEEESIEMSEVEDFNTKRTFCFSKLNLNSQQSIEQTNRSLKKVQDQKKSPFHKNNIQISFTNDMHQLSIEQFGNVKENTNKKIFQKKKNQQQIEDIPVMEEQALNQKQSNSELQSKQNTLISIKINQKIRPKYQKKKQLVIKNDQQSLKTKKCKKNKKLIQRMSIQPVLKDGSPIKKRFKSQTKNDQFESFINLYQPFHTENNSVCLKKEKKTKKQKKKQKCDSIKQKKNQKKIDIFLTNNFSGIQKQQSKHTLYKQTSDTQIAKYDLQGENLIQKTIDLPLQKNFYSKTQENFFQKTLFGKYHKTINFEPKKFMNVTNIINSSQKKKKNKTLKNHKQIAQFQQNNVQSKVTNFDRSVQDVHRNYFQSIRIQNRYSRVPQNLDYTLRPKYKVPKNNYKIKNYTRKLKPGNQSTNLFQNSIDYDLNKAYKDSTWIFKKKSRFTHH